MYTLPNAQPGSSMPMNNSMNMQQPQMANSMPMQQPMTPMSSFKKGGKVKMTPAHMSKHEMDILDHLQGRTERTAHGVRTYPHFEELLSNPHLHAMITHHARQSHAEGGDISPHMEHDMEQHGRHGDTEVALLGPRTHHFFHSMATGGAMNPDGHPEYWSIGGALGGLWKGIKGAGSAIAKHGGAFAKAAAPHVGSALQAAAPALTDIAAQHLQKHLGDAGGMLAGLGGQLAGGLGGKLAGPNGSQLGTAIGSGLGQFAKAKNEGQSFGQAAGQGLSQAGSHFGEENPTGQLLGSVGQGLQSGQSAKQILSGAAPHAIQGGLNAVQHGMQGQGLRHSLTSAARSFLPQGHQMNHEAMMPQEQMAY